MKKIFILIGMAAFIFTACNKSVAPDNVVAKFKEMYPGVEKAEWEKAEEGIFEATFEFEAATWEAEFDAEGNWIESSKEITPADMPAKATEYLTLFYADMTPEFEFQKGPEAEMFCAEMMKDSAEIMVCFDADGKVVKDDNNVVLAKFLEANASATDVVWSKMEDGTFNASFTLDGKTWESGFNTDGSWVCSGTDLTVEELPVAISDYLKKMKSFVAESYKMKKTAEGSKYVVDGKIKDTPISFIFDEAGKFIEQIDQTVAETK